MPRRARRTARRKDRVLVDSSLGEGSTSTSIVSHRQGELTQETSPWRRKCATPSTACTDRELPWHRFAYGINRLHRSPGSCATPSTASRTPSPGSTVGDATARDADLATELVSDLRFVLRGEESDLCSVNIDDKVAFSVPSQFRFLWHLGDGSYGMVAAFEGPGCARRVAVKKCPATTDALRATAREVQILRRTVHPNIVSMYGAYTSQEDVYIMIELMDTDLLRMIRDNGEDLTHERSIEITGEILRGVNYLHSLGVVHRDLKPANVLLNIQGEAGAEHVNNTLRVKLCDFNHSRGGSEAPATSAMPWQLTPAQEAADDAELSDYVGTRWYRAPEVVLFKRGSYGAPMDIWAIGCILCELLTLQVFFPGEDLADQLHVIFAALGVPTQDDLKGHELRAGNKIVITRLRASCPSSPRPLSEFCTLLPGVAEEAVRAAQAMLALDPRRRPFACDCLAWPCFRGNESVGVVQDAGEPLDWSFDVPEPSWSHLHSLIATAGVVGSQDK